MTVVLEKVTLKMEPQIIPEMYRILFKCVLWKKEVQKA
jgi:hypothetical protein